MEEFIELFLKLIGDKEGKYHFDENACE